MKKQSSISSFFVKRSATTTDELLRPSKKIKADSPSSKKQQEQPQKQNKQIESIKEEEDEAATPPIPQSPPSPHPPSPLPSTPTNFADDDEGGDTEEDEELQEQAKKSMARRSQSMPEHALKAAIKTNNSKRDKGDTDNEGEEEDNKQVMRDAFSKSTSKKEIKIDKSKSKLLKQQTLGSQTLQIRQGDITEECTGAIVNAANSSLAHGGGVAGAISRKGGPQIQQESSKWVRKNGTVPAGKVAVTGPGDLPCSTVIHAVGPVWTNGKHGEDKELYGAVWHSLLKAHQMDLPSIAIPAISSGIFGFPKERCAYIMTECAVKFCAKFTDSPLKEIRFTNFDRETVEIFSAEFRNRFESDDENEKTEKNEKGDDSDEEVPQTTKPTKTTTAKQINTPNHTSPDDKKRKRVTNHDSGDDTEEDEDLAQPTGYESSDEEEKVANNKDNTKIKTSNKKVTTNNTNNSHDSGNDSGSDVEWGKWQK